MTTTNGTRFKSEVLQKHIETDYHKECERLFRLSSIEDKSSQAPLKISMDKAAVKMINHVAKLMMQIFVDAKQLSQSAHSWPARYVASAASFVYDFQEQTKPTIPENIPMQYVNKPGHLSLLTTIVNSHVPDFIEKINECWAVSLRVDGSVDLTQIDKIYVMAKVINADGSMELLFIGIAQQTERKAIGLTKATINAITTIIGLENKENFLEKVSSLCTDGTNVNTGEKNSLWTLLDKEMKAVNPEMPVIKIWCAAHRAQLAWQDACANVGQVSKVLSVLSNISSFFHQSGLRTGELEEIGQENGIKVRNLPKIFLVRWCEFTFSLLRNVLISWNALVLYFMRHPKNAEAAGYLRYLTTIRNVKLIAFLADVLYTYQRFQKIIQSDRLTIISLISNLTSLKKSLERLESSPLPGGFEHNLNKQMYWCSPNGKTILKDIELLDLATYRENTSLVELRKEILRSLREFLDNRFEADDVFVQMIQPFISFDSNTDIEAVHAKIAPDLSLPNLSLQFQDIASDAEVYDGSSLSQIIVKLCKTDESKQNYKELITVLARIAACTPHSADIERSISADHRLKSKLRTNMNLETENKYLYVHYNMPDLADWEPKNAAKLFYEEKTRRERDASSATGSKLREQEYFKGIFPEAQNSIDPDAELVDTDDEKSNKFFEF